MKKTRWLGLLFIPLLLSGCYNYRELNDLGITTAVSIDYNDENEEFEIITQVINPVKQQDSTSSGEPTFVNFSSQAKSLQEAFRLVILESPRQLYGSHLQIILLSEKVVEEHLTEVLDFFARDPELRSEFKIVIAKNTEALQSISVQTLLNDLSAMNIVISLEKQNEKEGITPIFTLNEVTNMYLNPYLELVLPSIEIEGEANDGESEKNVETTNPKARVKIGTASIFKDDKLVDFLSIDQSKALTFMMGQLKETIITMETDDGYIAFQPNRIKTKKEADVKNNKVTVTIEGFAQISEVNSLINLKSFEEINNLQKRLNNKISDMIENTFYDIQKKYNTDVLGFRNLFYITDNKYFKAHDMNWYEEIFPNTKIEVKSKLKLYEKGNTLGGVEYERENW